MELVPLLIFVDRTMVAQLGAGTNLNGKYSVRESMSSNISYNLYRVVFNNKLYAIFKGLREKSRGNQ